MSNVKKDLQRVLAKKKGLEYQVSRIEKSFELRNEGRLDRSEGVRDNPYEQDSFEFKEWQFGWDQMELFLLAEFQRNFFMELVKRLASRYNITDVDAEIIYHALKFDLIKAMELLNQAPKLELDETQEENFSSLFNQYWKVDSGS